MRRVGFGVRRLLGVALIAAVAVSAAAVPREDREPRDRTWKIVKKVVRSLGDLLTIPTPPPKP